MACMKGAELVHRCKVMAKATEKLVKEFRRTHLHPCAAQPVNLHYPQWRAAQWFQHTGSHDVWLNGVMKLPRKECDKDICKNIFTFIFDYLEAFSPNDYFGESLLERRPEVSGTSPGESSGLDLRPYLDFLALFFLRRVSKSRALGAGLPSRACANFLPLCFGIALGDAINFCCVVHSPRGWTSSRAVLAHSVSA